MTDLKLLFWNSNGFTSRRKTKLMFLRGEVDSIKPSIFGLVQSHIEEVEDLPYIPGYNVLSFHASNGRSAGLALWARTEVFDSCSSITIHRRYLCVDFLPFRIIVIYGYTGEIKLNEDLPKDLTKLIKPSNTMVMGDFNDLVLDDLDFVDGWNVCGAGRDFTFSRGDIQTRIDKFYYNAFDGNLIPIITNAHATASDHWYPVSLHLRKCNFEKRFFFPDYILHFPSIVEEIRHLTTSASRLALPLQNSQKEGSTLDKRPALCQQNRLGPPLVKMADLPKVDQLSSTKPSYN